MGLLGSLFKVGASLIGGNSAKKASKKAQAAQLAGLQQAQGALNDQFDDAQDMASPWTSGGAAAQNELLTLLGLSGSGPTNWAAYVHGNPDALANWNAIKNTSDGAQFGGDISKFGEFHYNADGAHRDLTPYTEQLGGGDQAAVIQALKDSPVYKALFGNAVDATLANASATGGLRGGNTQDALARVGSDTLAKVYQDRIANLGSVSGAGLGATGNLQQLGADNARAIASLFGAKGDTEAGGILQRAGINSQMLNTIASEAGKVADGGDFGKVISAIGKAF